MSTGNSIEIKDPSYNQGKNEGTQDKLAGKFCEINFNFIRILFIAILLLCLFGGLFIWFKTRMRMKFSESNLPSPMPTILPTSKVPLAEYLKYTNKKYGFEIKYPPPAFIIKRI